MTARECLLVGLSLVCAAFMRGSARADVSNLVDNPTFQLSPATAAQCLALGKTQCDISYETIPGWMLGDFVSPQSAYVVLNPDDGTTIGGVTLFTGIPSQHFGETLSQRFNNPIIPGDVYTLSVNINGNGSADVQTFSKANGPADTYFATETDPATNLWTISFVGADDEFLLGIDLHAVPVYGEGYQPASFNNVSLTVTPEPRSYAVLILALCVVMVVVKSRRSKRA